MKQVEPSWGLASSLHLIRQCSQQGLHAYQYLCLLVLMRIDTVSLAACAALAAK